MRRSTDPEPDDRFRGLYVSEANIEGILEDRWPLFEDAAALLRAETDSAADARAAAGEVLRLRTLATAFGLDSVDVEILLVALAPDIDQRFEPLYGYLHDDVSRRRASIGLALELCGLAPFRGDARARLSRMGALVAGGLLVVEDTDRPLLTRSLRVPDRVADHLLGQDAPDPQVAPFLVHMEVPSTSTRWEALERALAEEISPIYLREGGMAAGLSAASSSIAAIGAQALLIDLERAGTALGRHDVVAAVVREARLRGAVLVAGPLPAQTELHSEALAMLAEAPCRVVLFGDRPWDPELSRAIPLVLTVQQPEMAERIGHWLVALKGDLPGNERDNDHLDLVRSTLAFRLTPVQQMRAARAGALRARAEARALVPADIQAGARAQNAAGLDRLARRIEPTASWVDLVLPRDIRGQLRELTARARQRERVLDEWGIGGRASRGRGITALFAGESGTGKTLAAEVVAGELGLDLYVIDLSTVVDKYIGETEKNLDRIFAEADRVNGVLLFDEADAIFGKRSEVRDARDRYANVEVAYLLQRMERFDGLAVLTTNMRANIDEAFTRRIDAVVDFPVPEDEDRLSLWRMHLPESLPQRADLDLEFMARRFRLSGGNIRNVSLSAAFLAAEGDRPVSMADLIRGTEREYQKLGRLTVEAEFGPYFTLTGADQPRA
ncbi:MAG: ATP-binding protein [Chloroflexi bacterium]|nr:ATP-binding protein [Chloroflexota bacterium]